MLEAGEQLGRYRICSGLGAGGMGEVFLADDARLNRKVALKVLPETLAADSERLRRFEQEAKAASALNHPNILTIFEFGAENGTHFLAAEYIKGVTLRERIKQDDLTLPETLDIAAQIASALQAAHASGIIHRDIKPENVMIRADGYVKVLDFGLAKLSEPHELASGSNITDEEAETRMQVQTQAGMVMGTADYMSPEQARGTLDARTDIFSLGVVLYEMLTGRQPFTGETINHTIVAILEKEPSPLSHFISGYPAEIERIIKKCLAKKADERYQSAKNLLDDLKELKEELVFQSKLERSASPDKNAEAETRIIKAVTTAENESSNSIAVLPFTNMSADAENEYFCDGLAEELLNALAKIEDLKVAARTSSFSFKNKNTEISQIGKVLNVKTVLEGSVRKSGNKLRITVQLINAADGYHLWSERYDREMQDIFDVQDEITLAVTDALKVKLLGAEKAVVLKRYTDNTEAYELYLKGLYHYNKHTVEGWLNGIKNFEQAIRIEPQYAPAYAGIGICYTMMHIFGVLPPDEIIPKWKEATNHALAIDERLSEGHLSLAAFHFYYEWDWTKAERAFQRAIEVSPNAALAHFFFGLFLATRERGEEGIREGRRALELDPLSLQGNGICGWIYMFSYRQNEAVAQARRLKELEPNLYFSFWLEGAARLSNGNFDDAVEALRKATDLADDPIVLSTLGCAYGMAGRRNEAFAILNRMLKNRENQYTAAFNIARVYAGLDETDKAFEWLDKAIDERDGELVYFHLFGRIGPGKWWRESFVSDPRYQKALGRIGLTEADETTQFKTTNEPSEAQTAILLPAATNDKEIPAVIVKTDEQTTQASNPKSGWWLFVLLGLILLTSAFFAYRYFTPVNKQIESIAVLPFENASGNADLDYLSDGVSESVIDRLSQLGQLKVIARSSSFQYRGQNLDLKKIAESLGVEAIVTGRVLQRGDNYQIRVDVMDARNNSQFWGENFTRKASDIQILQTDISREIAENLRLRLSGTQTQQIAKQTTNPHAFELVLKGEFYRNKGGGENQRKAVEYFQQAIVIDPNYALAYARLADAYRGVGGDPKEMLPKREAAIRRALELDPNLAEAHFDMGQYQRDLWNWEEAEKAYRRAMQINPNYAHAYSGLSGLLSLLGRHEEAIVADKRATELDPVGIIVNTVAGRTLYYARRYDEAIEQLKKTIEFDQSSPTARRVLANVYFSKGMYAEAVAEYELTIKLGGAGDGTQGHLGAAYAKMGERERTLEILKRMQTDGGTLPPNQVAILYAALGDKEQAFAILERAYAERSPGLQFLKVNPAFDDLRSDPRFRDLLRQMGLPQ